MKDKEISVSYKRSLLIGMFLGDSSARIVTKVKLSSVWRFAHSESQKDLVEWKRQEIQRLFQVNPHKISSVHHGKFPRHQFDVHSSQRFRIIRKWFTRHGKKCITEKIRFMDHPAGLAMLMCDDGSVRKRIKWHKDGTVYYLKPSFTIATHGFSEFCVRRLLSHLEKQFGIAGIINWERRWRNGERKSYPRCHFNVENSRRMWSLMAPYIPYVPSMQKKFAYALECFGTDAEPSCERGEEIVQSVQTTEKTAFMRSRPSTM